MYKLSIWDTAGQEQFHCLNTVYYRGAQGKLKIILTGAIAGALIVYDITDVDSFQKMSMWVKELRHQAGPNLPIIVVGNKADLENNRQIKKEEAEKYAQGLGLDHFSASARTGNNVKEIFTVLTERKYEG